MVQLLLLKGADKDAHDDQEMDNTTHRAVLYGHLAADSSVIAAGADVKLRCGGFLSPVTHLAAQEGYAVIKDGAEVGVGDTILTTASSPIKLCDPTMSRP